MVANRGRTLFTHSNIWRSQDRAHQVPLPNLSVSISLVSLVQHGTPTSIVGIPCILSSYLGLQWKGLSCPPCGYLPLPSCSTTQSYLSRIFIHPYTPAYLLVCLLSAVQTTPRSSAPESSGRSVPAYRLGSLHRWLRARSCSNYARSECLAHTPVNLTLSFLSLALSRFQLRPSSQRQASVAREAREWMASFVFRWRGL